MKKGLIVFLLFLLILPVVFAESSNETKLTPKECCINSLSKDSNTYFLYVDEDGNSAPIRFGMEYGFPGGSARPGLNYINITYDNIETCCEYVSDKDYCNSCLEEIDQSKKNRIKEENRKLLPFGLIFLGLILALTLFSYIKPSKVKNKYGKKCLIMSILSIFSLSLAAWMEFSFQAYFISSTGFLNMQIASLLTLTALGLAGYSISLFFKQKKIGITKEAIAGLIIALIIGLGLVFVSTALFMGMFLFVIPVPNAIVFYSILLGIPSTVTVIAGIIIGREIWKHCKK